MTKYTLSTAMERSESFFPKSGYEDEHKLVNGSGDDTIFAGSGNDSVWTYDGNDVIFGGSGDDHLVAGSGDDEVHGDSGDDSVWAGIGNDQLFGNAGHDYLNGSLGNDEISGGSGDDTMIGDLNDTVFGGDGSDIFYTSGVGEGGSFFGGDDENGYDVLNLSFYQGEYTIEYDPEDPTSGTVFFTDNGTSLTFTGVEEISNEALVVEPDEAISIDDVEVSKETLANLWLSPKASQARLEETSDDESKDAINTEDLLLL